MDRPLDEVWVYVYRETQSLSDALAPWGAADVDRLASLGRRRGRGRSYSPAATKEEIMLRRSELPSLSDIPSVDEDPALFDPTPEWFVPGLTPLRGEAQEPDDDELGLRAILERPEALTKAWQASGRERRIARSGRSRRSRTLYAE